MKNLSHIFHFFAYLLSFFLFSCTANNPADNSLDENAFVSQVFEFKYAPGQYASSDYSAFPQYFKGIPAYLQTKDTTKMPISLGGWGGYIIAGFNHNITNKTGNDFIVFCGSSASPEPGVVYVMEDTNANGLPDDSWYELKGSEFANTSTIRDYSVTYTKPASTNKNITWTDNKGNSGMLKNGFGTDSTAVWWKYTDETTMTFTGTRLPDAYYNNSSTSTQNWVMYPNLFTWGYAENAQGTVFNTIYKGNEFDISNAVDANGNAVLLSSIRFIKVQTGVFQQAGWLNEISTEIYGAADLSMLKK